MNLLRIYRVVNILALHRVNIFYQLGLSSDLSSVTTPISTLLHVAITSDQGIIFEFLHYFLHYLFIITVLFPLVLQCFSSNTPPPCIFFFFFFNDRPPTEFYPFPLPGPFPI